RYICLFAGLGSIARKSLFADYALSSSIRCRLLPGLSRGKWMSTERLPFTLTIPSDLRMLAVARDFVEAICQSEELDRATTHAIGLAAGEAITNVIRHSHHNRPEIPLHIGCRLEAGAMEVVLRAHGEPFDLEAVPPLDPGELRVGGRGVFL